MWDCPCASHFIQGMDTTWQPCPKQKRRWEGGKCPFSFCCCCLQAAASADFSNRFSLWSFPHFPWTCHILPTKSLYISEKKCYTKGMSTHHFRKSLIMYVRVCVHMLKTFIRAFLCYSCFKIHKCHTNHRHNIKVFTVELAVYSAIQYIHNATEAASKCHSPTSVIYGFFFITRNKRIRLWTD